MTNREETWRIYQVRRWLKVVFVFAEHFEKATFGLGFILTIQRPSDNFVLKHRAGTEAANIVFAGIARTHDFSWYIPQHVPDLSQQILLLVYIVSRAATELPFNKRSSYTKDVITEVFWTSELG